MGENELPFSLQTAKLLYNEIPKMVLDIETEIFKESFSREIQSEIMLLNKLLKDYFNDYILEKVKHI